MRWKAWRIGISTDNRGAAHGSLQVARPDILRITAFVQCACWPTNVFYQMKLRDTFAPIGSYIVTADEIKDPHKLQIRLTNNGVVMQDFNTDDMALPLRFACAAVT